MREFDKWISPRKEKYEGLLDEAVRLDAFSVTIGAQKRMAAFDHVVKAFSLNHQGNEYLVPCVEVYILQHKFKEVRSLNKDLVFLHQTSELRL